MKHHLSPKYKNKIGDSIICWFQNSNSYVILNDELNNLIEHFLASKDKTSFFHTLKKLGYSSQDCQRYFFEINQLLTDLNSGSPVIEKKKTKPKHFKNSLSESYSIWDLKLSIHFESEKIKQLIHPSIAYLTEPRYVEHETQVYIYQVNEDLVLANTKSIIYECLAKDYHKLQGKFSLLLVNFLYNTKEKEFLACFHASTVSINTNALMLVGSSGSGKSTLSALLQKQGFKMVADDVSYLDKTNLSIKAFPAGISIKDGSTDVLKSLYPNIELLPKIKLNTKKGHIRYINPNSASYLDTLSCKIILLVNYKENSNTHLQPISADIVLKTLIPESWISPDEAGALKFLNWLETVKFYKLTYSETTSISDTLKTLLPQ